MAPAEKSLKLPPPHVDLLTTELFPIVKPELLAPHDRVLQQQNVVIACAIQEIRGTLDKHGVLLRQLKYQGKENSKGTQDEDGEYVVLDESLVETLTAATRVWLQGSKGSARTVTYRRVYTQVKSAPSREMAKRWKDNVAAEHSWSLTQTRLYFERISRDIEASDKAEDVPQTDNAPAKKRGRPRKVVEDSSDDEAPTGEVAKPLSPITPANDEDGRRPSKRSRKSGKENATPISVQSDEESEAAAASSENGD